MTDISRAKVKIEFISPFQAHVYVNGKEIHDVAEVSVIAKPGDYPVVWLRIIAAGGLEIEGDAEVGTRYD